MTEHGSHGQPSPFTFVADIAANHDADLDRARRLIDLAAEAGADVAKFQHFRAETIVSDRGFAELGANKSHQASWKRSVFDTYRHYALPYEWTEELADHCGRAGIQFMSTPYDFEAVDRLAPLVCAFKVGSGDINWLEFLDYIALQGKPMLVATGASRWDEVQSAAQVVTDRKVPLTLMQCNTNYTGAPENARHLNLRVLSAFSRAYPDCEIGLSDHTRGNASIQLAVALGATVFERHFTDDSSRDGPDHAFSLNPQEWRSMIESAREAIQLLGSDSKVVEVNELESRVVQRRAIRLARTLSAGTVLEREHIVLTRPCPPGALDASQVAHVIGMRLNSGVERDSLLSMDHLNEI